MVALNDKFSVSPYSRIENKSESNKFNSKDFWDSVCKDNPSKRECLFYCD